MSAVEVPNFGELLAPYIGSVPEHAVPNFLALLERGAADRYRYWAEQLPDFSDGLNVCAASEDKIADIVESLFPIAEDLAAEIAGPLPDARQAYYSVFEPLTLKQQLQIQAAAELQGAKAWEAMLVDGMPAAMREGLEQCMKLERESSTYLYSIIDQVG
ncbi:hypothetical protein EYC98_05305 [Halieaceae bacterium IMCC14734]|uniref:Uncharacterized protein n=1 Tax=Candidatus Litorirhabdus singularis TaxID=2518993 RepID=A0ABT3TEN8_9GAMM|nr:hypothetical protein [Candidatus Litorirhabdus singularis]MCX2980285.1 hypothetical protein [Candidatus Litorirhabdus singularis]